MRKYILCASRTEALNLKRAIDLEMGYPIIHTIGVDAFIENPGKASHRFYTIPGIIKTDSGAIVAYSILSEPVVILESPKIELEATGSIDGLQIRTAETFYLTLPPPEIPVEDL